MEAANWLDEKCGVILQRLASVICGRKGFGSKAMFASANCAVNVLYSCNKEGLCSVDKKYKNSLPRQNASKPEIFNGKALPAETVIASNMTGREA